MILISDSVRQAQINADISRSGCNLFVCKVAENIFALSGVFSFTGNSVCIAMSTGERIVYLPSSEFLCNRYQLENNFNVTVVQFDSTKELVYNAVDCIHESTKSMGEKITIGIDSDFDLVSSLHIGGDVRIPNNTFWNTLKQSCDNYNFIDITRAISLIRSIKSETQLHGIKKSVSIAKKNVNNILENKEDMVSEIQFSSDIERAIKISGIEEYGANSVQSYVFCMSGENSSYAGESFNISTKKKIRATDPILIELATCVDGYWSDLTRTYLGSNKCKDHLNVFDVINRGIEYLIGMCVPGMEVNKLAKMFRKYLEKFQLDEYYNGFLGHGVGFAYHEYPIISETSTGILQEGMVVAIEPGVYINNKYGIRVEENIYICRDGGCLL